MGTRQKEQEASELDAKVRHLKRGVMLCISVLFLTWFVLNFKDLTDSQNGGLRFSLALVFSLMILLRSKSDSEEGESLLRHEPMPMSWAVTGVGGAAVVLAGLILEVRQVEWIGLLTLIYASFRWIMPERASKDIFLALFLLYWAHPLPGQVFAPLQFAMQRISVSVSEWFMHMINVSVWADDMILRTGGYNYEIPAACSGLRTATTVFLLSMGLGILFRFKLRYLVLLVVAALMQAVILNVIRITVMVTLAPTAGTDAGIDFLHDTAGIIVIGAVLLIYLEIMILERFRRARAFKEEDLNSGLMDGLSEFPSFWRYLVSHKIKVVTIISVVVLTLGFTYKSRAYHRAEMLKAVSESLRESGKLDSAIRLAGEIRMLVPGDREWHFETIRMMILQGDYQDVLDEISRLPGLNSYHQMERNVLEAYALTGLERYKEAKKVIEKLPATVVDADPRVAVIMAELGMYSNTPEMIRKHIETASKWVPNTGRIRALYPYMRAHRLWKEISISDKDADYQDIVQALSATEAYMNLNNTSAVAGIVLQSLRKWPHDARILTPLFFLAIEHLDPKWENRFSEHLLRCIPFSKDPDKLNTLFPLCFQLKRPDLVWKVFERISELDPKHPSLSMCVVRYGHNWFTFRRHWLGFSSERPTEEIDMKPFFIVGSPVKSWTSPLYDVPLGLELCVADPAPIRKRYLRTALKEFSRRDADGTMTDTLRYEYIRSLGVENNIDSIESVLKKMASEDPRVEERNRDALSEVYERAGAWCKVYEVLKDYSLVEDPNLKLLLRLFKAQDNLKFRLAAFNTATLTASRFPNSPAAAVALAQINLDLGRTEEALSIIGQGRTWHNRRMDSLEAEALWKTERYYKAEEKARSAFLAPRSVTPALAQQNILPPAELSVMWHHLFMPSEKDFADAAESIRENLPEATGAFLKSMNKLWLECYDSKCKGSSAKMKRWIDCGRTNEEKATALSQLVLHLCRSGMFDKARNTAAAAVRFMPESPVLWQMLISLSRADSKVIDAAREFCPRDGAIWLADVVVSKDADTELISELTPATLTRGAEFLFRINRKDKAVVLMRVAVPKARGLLPAYIMGARCALFANDKKWAAECTRKAIASSLRPTFELHRKLVQIKTAGSELDTDTEMINILNIMREEDPDNPLWAEMLGYVRYSRGGVNILGSMYQMLAAIDKGSEIKQAYIMAAESARKLGNHEKAVEVLKKAIELYPDDIALLNNLVYTLSMSPNHSDKISQHLPELEKSAADNPVIMDTLALAYVVSKEYKAAEKKIDGILKLVPENGPLWFRAKMHKAEIALRLDMPNKASIILLQIMSQSKGISNEDILIANRLLAECQDVAE